MPDGTVKQINPFTGNEVWAVPGRSARPLDRGRNVRTHVPAVGAAENEVCPFCSTRYRETPPEKLRVVRNGDEWETFRNLAPADYFNSTAEFRCVPNLFEIVTLDYWEKNYGYNISPGELERLESFTSDPLGIKHLRDVIAYKNSLANNGNGSEPDQSLPERTVHKMSRSFFGGCHELIIARQHFVDGGGTGPEAELVSSGLLTPEEHYHYTRTTVDAMVGIHLRNRYVRYVSVFQNWLRPAGASFDHLHKQLVGLDEWGSSISRQVQMLLDDPNAFNAYASNFASMHNLMIAENDHAVAFAGIGHRFPTIEIFSRSRNARPDEHADEELRGVSDLVHAVHAAMGPHISCNEEWYYSPFDTIVKMPWHVLIKWRINVPAGFEGGTSIYINPMTPLELRDHMVPNLYRLRSEEKIEPLHIAAECRLKPNMLEYYR